jgi:hypothetical protein
MSSRRVPKVSRHEMQDIFVGCRRSSRAHLEHRRRYHGAAIGTEAMRFLIVWMAGWINSRQLEVIDFLREEPRTSGAARWATAAIHR